MFSHVTIGTNDIQRTKRFYDATLAVFGHPPGQYDKYGRLVYLAAGNALLITYPLNGFPAFGANGGTIGFQAGSIEEANTWHAVGLANGGKTCEDPPGERVGKNLYMAFLRDPDGNKICTLFDLPVPGEPAATGPVQNG